MFQTTNQTPTNMAVFVKWNQSPLKGTFIPIPEGEADEGFGMSGCFEHELGWNSHVDWGCIDYQGLETKYDLQGGAPVRR